MKQDYKLLVAQLKWLKEVGVDYYLSYPITKDNAEQEVISNASGVINQMTSIFSKARAIADKISTIEQLKAAVEAFDGCELKNFATNTVFADGIATNAKVMLLGEAPGVNEDKYGVPFCGESGQLLDQMLECINLSRKTNTYITNTIFWRPPANRKPTQEEIDACRPFVEKHISLVNPKLLILVGATAATCLLGKHEGVGAIRNNYYQYKNEYMQNPIVMMAIFHPAYLLRQPSQKKHAWFDLIRIKKYLDTNG